VSETTSTSVEAFIERHRRERLAEGKAATITSPEVYRLLDGLLITAKRPAKNTAPNT
jgi:hypothetical protein